MIKTGTTGTKRVKKANKILKNIEVQDFAAEGKSVSRVHGKVVFLEGCVPGDVVDAEVIRDKKSFVHARPVAFHQRSALRKEPFCSHFGTCGGCKWQHVDYAHQLKFKFQQVVDQLTRIGKVDLPEISPIIGSEDTTLYRNKLEYTFTNHRWLTREEVSSGQELDRNGCGFHSPGRFDKIIDIEQCHLQKEPSNEIRLFVKYFGINNGLSFYNVRENRGLLRNLIIRNTTTGQLMVIVQFGDDDQAKIEMLMTGLRDTFPEIDSLHYIVNTKKNETYYDLEVHCFNGRPYIEEVLEGVRFRIGPKSFFQTNSSQALKLYEIVKDFADLEGDEVVYDLYTGIGSIACYIAGSCGKVIGIESIAESIQDARDNANLNEIQNAEFLVGDVAEVLNSDVMKKGQKPDLVITDPPRAGMEQKVVSRLLEIGPNRIVYVSCNPATQARDLEMMSHDYQITAVQPIDMFPHTQHVENVVLMVRKN